MTELPRTGQQARSSAQERTSQIAFSIACVSGLAGLATISIPVTNAALGLLTMVILPFGLVYLYTRRLTDSLTVVWISEVFFGGNGYWAQLGPVSARWALLALLLASTAVRIFLRVPVRDPDSMGDKAVASGLQQAAGMYTVPVLLYGLLFPSWLVVYSVVGQGTPFWRAVGDVDFLLALLAYFPVRLLVRRHLDFLNGWMIGGVCVLGLFFLFLTLAPSTLAGSIFRTISGSELGTTLSGVNRAALPLQTLLFVGVFLGLLYAANSSQRMTVRLSGVLLMCVSIAAPLIAFVRGPLLSMALVTVLLSVVAGLRRSTRMVAVGSWIALLSFVVAATVLYSTIIPEGAAKFEGGGTGLTGFVDPVRIDQAERMTQAFSEKPILGQGVGVPIPEYTRTGEAGGLAFELQYLMLLYRLGLANFVVMVLPLFWFFTEPFRLLWSEPDVLGRRAGKLAVATLLALLAIFIAGALNPYLTAVFTPLLIAVYLSLRELCVTPVSALRTRDQASIAEPRKPRTVAPSDFACRDAR